MVGNWVSHANNRNKRRQFPNLQRKRVWIPEEGRWVRLRVSTSALRTMRKNGVLATLREAGLLRQGGKA